MTIQKQIQSQNPQAQQMPGQPGGQSGQPGQLNQQQQQRIMAQPANRGMPMQRTQQPPSPKASNFSGMSGAPPPGTRRQTASAISQPTMSRDSSPQPSFSSQVDPSSKQVLSKRKIQELVSQIDPREKIDPEVEDALLEIADDFIESLTNFGCMLAKHRKSDTLEAKDIQLHLEKNWSIRIPGFGSDEIKPLKKVILTDAHKQRLALLKKETQKGTGQKEGTKKH